ncbi:MAG TPA: RodZ domain-containing protein [Bryobacteraceae bacterium]|nr:RodZ domain-containing protein [Bryobacteraceae bacterium]
MTSLGETLRRERQKRNFDLDQISRELKISSRFLEAIEEERFDQLPAPVFAKSFVRQYATLLELDAEELVAEVQRRIAPEPPPDQPLKPPHEPLGSVEELHLPRVEEWESVGDRRGWSSSLPALAMVVAVMMVCSGVYAFWQHSRRQSSPQETARTAEVTPPPMQPVPQAAQPAAPGAPAAGNGPAAATIPAAGAAEPHPGEMAAAEPAAIPPSQRAAAPAAPPPAQTAAATAAAQQPNPAPAAAPPNAAAVNAAAPATTAGAAPATADANRADPNAAAATPGKGPVKIEITATEPVWVMARSNGKYIFSGTIDANQTKSVEADGTLLLRVGNAGGVSINFNGKTLNNLGPKGQVRDIQFTSGGFQMVAAPKPPSPPPAPGEPR